MLDLSNHYAIARQLAAEGMVLLKNEDRILPLTSEHTIALIGENCLNLIKGGGGSAEVMAEYTKTLADGLIEKAEKGQIEFYRQSTVFAAKNDFSLETLNATAQYADTAVVVYKRNGSEGSDRRLGDNHADKIEIGGYNGEQNAGNTLDDYENSVGYFYPSETEIQMFSNLELSNIQNVIVVLNISTTVYLKFLEQFSKIKAVLLTFLPGMEGGTGIADVLCGDVNPSGRLVDTVAYDYKDYPSAHHFNDSEFYTEYQEGIYVGYRYFETFAPDRVQYPFGFGLSYTDFSFNNIDLQNDNTSLRVHVSVKNTGKVAGKEVVQLYVKAPRGHLPKPAIELKGFAKTKLLQPGEKEDIIIELRVNDMASFDELGILGCRGAWMLEKGTYEILLGKNIRDTVSCGCIEIDNDTISQQLQVRLQGQPYEKPLVPITETVGVDQGICLYDVADGKASIEDFISQLTAKEMIAISCGQEPAFPLGTGGIGSLKSKGIPNPQTADGPAGIRRSVNTTCIPCGTLLACSWDQKLQYSAGKLLGFEGYHTGVDILLAPSVNIHRNPLCGRNFEYLSEDPLITGKTASAIIQGIQSQGMCATIKHFAVNNAEYFRNITNSIVGERALREIYLKGFEIAIKEAAPAFVMTSYNKLNGKHTSANIQLLKGVLRDEWNYQGAIMTDWRTSENLDNELLAGNNIKMPLGYPDQQEIALEAYRVGKITLADLQWNTYYILKAIMNTRAFKHRDFGIIHHLKESLEVPGVAVNSLSSTRVRQELKNGFWYLCGLGKDQRAQRTYAKYVIYAEQTGQYDICCKVSTNIYGAQIWVNDENNNKLGSMTLYSNNEDQVIEVQTTIKLQKGENVLKLVFACEPDKDYPFSCDCFYTREDIRLLCFRLSKI